MIRLLLPVLFGISVVAPANATELQPPARPAVLALIVTNNRASSLNRPDLRYADDDGAKYYQLFRMLTGAPEVVLLTDFDSDTAHLFLEFVFAGHGDIAGGRGFLELHDGVFNSEELEQLLQRIPATHAHVILDSCNSFFVLNPRKLGGRRFATSEEAAQRLSEKLPHVGVFLSTSAEGEVFEWSELQSGIFSHAVRSGLSGAADVDGDGRVSYEELAAFVETATKTVKNPLYRPTVFARGPDGQQKAPLIDLAGAQATLLTVDSAEHRLTVRDRDELPWVDLHKDDRAPLTLRLPERLAAGLSVEERRGATLVRREGAAKQPSP